MEDTYLFVRFYSSRDEGSEFIHYSVGIYLRSLHNTTETKIGYVEFYIINTHRYSDWNHVMYSADAISSDVLNIVDLLEDVIANEEMFSGLITVLDRISIEEKYRGLGLGTKAMEEIIKYLDILSIDYIALQPFPMEEEDEDKQKVKMKALVDFYKKLAFFVVKRKSETELLMGKNLNYV